MKLGEPNCLRICRHLSDWDQWAIPRTAPLNWEDLTVGTRSLLAAFYLVPLFATSAAVAEAQVAGFQGLGRRRPSLHAPIRPKPRKRLGIGRVLTLVGSVILISRLVQTAQAEIVLAVVGDSLSDEYAEQTYDYAFNWVEQLADHRVADIGLTAAEAGVGNWGEPRRTGYEYNWARFGAVTEDLARSQVGGTVSQVVPKDITHVVGLIGANDFHPRGATYLSIYNGTADPAEIEAGIMANIATIRMAMQTLKATGVKVVWGTVPDYALVPRTRIENPDPVKRERVTTVIRDVNDRLVDVALAEGIPVVDVFDLGKSMFGENGSENPTLRMGNVELQMLESDNINNTNPTAAFVHDGVHPHTTVQGVISVLFMEAFNLGYGDDIPLFTEEEILDHAGIAYGGKDTLLSELRVEGYSDLIIVPEPSTIASLILAASVLAACAWRRQRR